MELWDLYTEDRVKTGETHIRNAKIPKDRYHIVVNVWIKNSKGMYLISRRSKTKRRNPLRFETVGGAVIKGENSLQAALRETKEEVGIDLDEKAGKLIYSGRRKRLSSFLDVYLFNYDGPVDLRNATTDEVESARFMTIDEIKKLFDKKLFLSNQKYCFVKIFNQ